MSSKRLPLSCENCRRRKIRCLGSGHHAPCDTCSRRGYASTCRFARQITPIAQESPTSHQSDNLVGDLSTLENLLKRNIELTSALLSQKATGGGIPEILSPDSSPVISQPAQPEERTSSYRTHSIRMGRLVTSPSGHVRFISSHDMGGNSDLLNAMTSPPPAPGFPFFSEQQTPTIDELLDMLPPLLHVEELKSKFFVVFSPLFHILHDPTFHLQYQSFRENPKSTPLSFLALLFVVLSLSVTALDDGHPLLSDLGHDAHPGTNIRNLSKKYRLAAMRCLVADNFMFCHNLRTVQCLVLLIYALNHAQGPAWSLLGTTLHIAIAIGCAVDPAGLDVDRVEAEERRRCWAGLRMLYTVQNTCLGNLMPFRMDTRVALPLDIEDDHVFFSNHAAIPPANESPFDQFPTKMTYLLYKFRLYDLAFDICQFSSNRFGAHDRHKMEILDQRIGHETQCHIERFNSNPIQALELHHQAHFYILTIYTCHLKLLLHRPWLNNATVTDPGYISDSAQRCEIAAETMISSFERLCNDNLDFGQYRWYVDGLGSFYAFFAITTLLVLRPGRGGTVSVTDMIRRCVQFFVSNASRSEVCSKAAAILEPVVTMATQQPMTTDGKTSRINHGLGEQEVSLEDDAIWGSFPELEDLFYGVPPEQWLMPSVALWNASPASRNNFAQYTKV